MIVHVFEVRLLFRFARRLLRQFLGLFPYPFCSRHHCVFLLLRVTSFRTRSLPFGHHCCAAPNQVIAAPGFKACASAANACTRALIFSNLPLTTATRTPAATPECASESPVDR